MKTAVIIRAFLVVFMLGALLQYRPYLGPFAVASLPNSPTPTLVTTTTLPSKEPRPVAKPPVKPVVKPVPAPAPKPTTNTTLQQVRLGSLVSTADAFTELSGGEINITNPTIRATAPAASSQYAKVVFTYLGPTKSTAALASGEVRRQVAIKLLAQDLCNTLYVSWQFSPNKRLEVLEKYNPGDVRFENCGADGYTLITPSYTGTLPSVSVGSEHTLEARINNQNTLTVWADGNKVWEASVASAVKHMNGPVGLRTDNAVLRLKFYMGT